MKLFPRWHTPESVAKELIAGLENGSLALDPAQSDVERAVAETVRLAAEVRAAFADLAPEVPPPPAPQAHELADNERHDPGFALRTLHWWRAAHAEIEAIRAEERSLTRELALLWWLGLFAGAACACGNCYFLLTQSRSWFAAGLAVASASVVALAWPWLRMRFRAALKSNASMLSRLMELARQSPAAPPLAR